MSRKWILIALSLVVISMVLGGCAQPSGAQPAAKPASAASQPTVAVPPTAAAASATMAPVGPPITLRLGHDSAEASVKHAGALYWARILKEQSGGSITMQVFPGGSLGHDAQAIQGLQAGTIDGWIVGTSILFASVPQTQLLSTPYLFDNAQQALKFYETSSLVKEFASQAAAKNIHIVAWGDLGFRQLSNKVRPINNANDLVGLRMRVPPVSLYEKVFQMLGTTGTQLDFSELYLAMQQGTVDGQDNPIELTYSNKFYEVQPYYSLIQWCYEAYPFMISDAAWKRLTPEQQKIVQATGIEAARWETNETVTREAQMVKDMESKGMKVIENPDRNSFKQKLAPIRDWLQQQFGKDTFDRLQKEVAAAKS